MARREWLRDPSKRSKEYIQGVNEFLEFAFRNSKTKGRILCPCTNCVNCHLQSRTSVWEHLSDPRHGFLKGYRQWIFHDEKPTTSSSTTERVEMEHDVDALIQGVFGVHSMGEPDLGEGERSPEVGESTKFYQLVKENEEMLYPNCKKYSKLSFMVHLYHLKCLHGWSDKSFSMLLDLLRDALPEENVLPKSYYETKKIISGLGLGYEKIHACPNDCILYRDRYVKNQVCPKCGKSRWKTTNEDVQANGMETSEKRKKLPAKILRWFPLKPRLQRLFMSSKVAELMRWHHQGRLNDGSRKKKLNIGHRASNNEGIQPIPTNTNSANVQGSNVAETRSGPSHTEDVIHESIESHSIPSDIEAEEEQIAKEPKRARGGTRMLDVWQMEDDFIIVNLDKYGQPIGEEATTLTRFIGSVVRRSQYAPINIKSWKSMPDGHKNEMLKVIESKFEFVPPINDKTREMIKSELNEKWRQWKGDLKAMAYDPSKTKEEVASAVPDDRVDEDQYRELVDHWFSDDAKKISETNRQNRAKFKDVHCMCTKSLPKLIDEKMKKGKGVLPRRDEIYIETRTQKDGSIVNEEAARLIEEIKKYSNEVGTSQSAQNTQDSMSWKDDVFFKVQGPAKKGRVRCMGKFPKSKKSKVYVSENEELRDKVKLMEGMLANVMTMIQNRFSGEDVNAIIHAARQVTDASSAPNHLNSPSLGDNEDNENGED